MHLAAIVLSADERGFFNVQRAEERAAGVMSKHDVINASAAYHDVEPLGEMRLQGDTELPERAVEHRFFKIGQEEGVRALKCVAEGVSAAASPDFAKTPKLLRWWPSHGGGMMDAPQLKMLLHSDFRELTRTLRPKRGLYARNHLYGRSISVSKDDLNLMQGQLRRRMLQPHA